MIQESETVDVIYLSDFLDDIIYEEMKRIWGDSPSEWDKK